MRAYGWKTIGRRIAVFLTFMLALGMAQAESREIAATAGTSLRAIVASGRLEVLRWPNFPDYRLEVDSLYRRSGYSTIWIHKGNPTSQALEMISILRQADGKGLLAEDYDSAYWQERLARLKAGHTAADEARFDVALTVCTMRYISDLRIGRVNPRHFEFNLGKGPKRLDLPTLIQKRLVKGTNLKSVLAGVEPPSLEYAQLEKALVKYMGLAKQDSGEKLPDPHGIVFAGMSYDGLPRLVGIASSDW